MFGAISLTACVSADYEDEPYERPQPITQAEITFVKQMLNDLQPLSIEKNREYCGFIGLDASGEFVHSPPRRGRKGSCLPKEPKGDFTILASYHTHGAWSEDFDSEVPSIDDLVSDIDEGNDGYIATPRPKSANFYAAPDA